MGRWVAQTQGTTTTYYALDTAIGLPEVVYTSEGNAYLHLPGVIVAESNSGDTRYLLSDGLGSVRHAVDENATVIAHKDFDPYGNPLPTAYSLLPTPFGYTGEWWEDEVGLLYLRARWYQPETGTFLSRDAVENEPPYQYVRGNVVNWVDPSGRFPESLIRHAFGNEYANAWKQLDPWWWKELLDAEHGDMIISKDKSRVAQFVLDDPLMQGYTSVWTPFSPCYTPNPADRIRLEGYEATPGQRYSEVSGAFVDGWRYKTGSILKAGLHPNDPTWLEYIDGRSNRYVQYDEMWLYWLNLQGNFSHILQHIATQADIAALSLSVGQTAFIDTTGGAAVSGACATGVLCPASIAAFGVYDVVASLPFTVIDGVIGTGSLGVTAASDYFGGYTSFENGNIRIGESTVHSAGSLVQGLFPETHFQLYTNLKQVLYDFGVDDPIDAGIFDYKAIEIHRP